MSLPNESDRQVSMDEYAIDDILESAEVLTPEQAKQLTVYMLGISKRRTDDNGLYLQN